MLNNRKKILVLGGRPIGSVELVERAKERGIYVIVADYLPPSESPAKQIADEHWEVSTADINTLEILSIKNRIDGVLTGVHEFNINKMIELCKRLSLPCYCRKETWKYCDNKLLFKQLCIKNGIPVAKRFISEEEIENGSFYPVIVKPIDGSGSRGFSKCSNKHELLHAIEVAKHFSPRGEVLIEEFIPYHSTIIHYTMVGGKCFYSGMSDKISCSFKSSGAPVMGFQSFPSSGEQRYLGKLDSKVRRMYENAGFSDGPIWIEAFYDGTDNFTFNEMGYRFGGSLTYIPVKYFYEIDQLDLIIDVAIGESAQKITGVHSNKNLKYCILPVHIHPGEIAHIIGMNELKHKEYVNAIVPVHYIGDKIEDWGSAQQVFCYLHFLYDEKSELKSHIAEAANILHVLDNSGIDMLFTLFNIDSIN